ncbi:MAG TPA: ATP synthase F1 subunit epsilon [Patescibacteria group bacterium]
MHITVVTPEKTILDQEADELIVPTTAGQITVLPHHVPLFTQLAEGEIIIKLHGREEQLVVVGGFLEVNEKSITVLADYAVHGKDISAAKAEEAKQRAERAMKEKKGDIDFATAEAEFRRALLELKVANKYRKRS